MRVVLAFVFRVAQEDFMKAARKISDTKKLEGSSDYEKV